MQPRAPLKVNDRHKAYNALLIAAETFLAENNFNASIMPLKSAMQCHPDLPPALLEYARSIEQEAKTLTDEQGKKVLLGQALGYYQKVIQLTPDHVEALQQIIKLLIALGKQELVGGALEKYKKSKASKEEFVTWHLGELISYHPEITVDPLNSLSSFYGYSSLAAKQYAAAYYYFEQATQTQSVDYFAWCHLAELSAISVGVTNKMDVNATKDILDYLITVVNYPMAYAIQAIQHYDDDLLDEARTHAVKCVELIAASHLTMLNRVEDKFTLAFTKSDKQTGPEKLKQLKEFRNYFTLARAFVAQNKFVQAHEFASFAIWRLHAMKKSETQSSYLAATYKLRFETELIMNSLESARMDLAKIMEYRDSSPAVLKQVTDFIWNLVTQSNKNGSYEFSFNLLELALIHEKKNPDLFIEMASVLTKLNQPRAAKDYIDSAMELLPVSNARIDTILHNIKKQLTENIKEMEKRLFEEELEDFEIEFGEVYTETAMSLEYAQRAVPAGMTDFDLRSAFQAQRATDNKLILKYVQQALNHCPADFIALTRRANLYLNQHNYTEAMRDLTFVIDNWNYGPAYFVRGNYYLHQNDNVSARADFIRCLTSCSPTSVNPMEYTAEAVFLILDLPLASLSKKKPANKQPTDSLETLKDKLRDDPLNAAIFLAIAVTYVEREDFASANLYASFAVWFDKADPVPYLILRSKINLVLGNPASTYCDMALINNLLPYARDTLAIEYDDSLQTLGLQCLDYANQAFAKQEYAKARILYTAVKGLGTVQDVQSKINFCDELLAQLFPPEESAELKEDKIEVLCSPKNKPAKTVFSPKANLPKKPPKEPKSNNNFKTELAAPDTIMAEILDTLAPVPLVADPDKAADRRTIKNKKNRERAKKKRDERIQSRPEKASNAVAEQPQDLPVDLPVDLTTTITPISGDIPSNPEPQVSILSPRSLRSFIPKKIHFAEDSIPVKIALYLKELAAKNGKSYHIYLVGGAVTDKVLSVYLKNLQAALLKKASEALANFIDLPMFDRVRYGVHINDYDMITDLPVAEMEAMGAALVFTPISQPLAEARSFILDKTKIDLLHRPNLSLLDHEMEHRLHRSLFLSWDQATPTDTQQYGFDLKDPSRVGIQDLALGVLHAPDAQNDYNDPVKILFTFYQASRRQFEIHKDDIKTIRANILKLKVNDVGAVNAQIKKLFCYCQASTNYQKLIDTGLLDSLFSPYFTRCLKADSDWLTRQIAEVNEVPLPRLKRIYAILIVSIAMQELCNEYHDDKQRQLHTLFQPAAFFDVSMTHVFCRARNIIRRFALLQTYFANEQDGDISYYLNKHFHPLVIDWKQNHDKNIQGFFSSFAVPPKAGNPMDGLALLINTAEDGIYHRPRSPSP